MRSRTLTLILFGIIIAAGLVFIYTLYNSDLYYAQTTGPAPINAVEAPIATSSDPARLIVHSLSINASVQDLGVNSIGNMQAPDNFVDVGWYKYGTVPGYQGSAVI